MFWFESSFNFCESSFVQSFSFLRVARLRMAKALEKDGVFMHGLCHQKPRPQATDEIFFAGKRSGKMSGKKMGSKKMDISDICIREIDHTPCNPEFLTESG